MFVIGGVVMVAFCVAMLSCAKITGNNKRYEELIEASIQQQHIDNGDYEIE